MKRIIVAALMAMMVISAKADAFKTLINNEWTFALGHATSPENDFSHDTEYFSRIAKVRAANQSVSPVVEEFDDSDWTKVNLPHDWVVDLPFSGDASHSHGYKMVGWKYPENSVGWYRKHISVPAEDKGKQIWIEFEGIFRDSQIYCNGCYLGGEKSGYVSRVYNLTPYLKYGEDNVITVRCDASLEEGWYYEGAGIYGNVWLHKAGPVAIKPYSLVIDKGRISFETALTYNADASLVSSEIAVLDAEGNEVSEPDHLWSLSDPYLYTARIRLFYKGELSAEYCQKFGVRDAVFDKEQGFLLNGKPVKLKGCNLHLDHAGVGVAVPKELWRYRLEQLRKYGFNAIRSSHNPASPMMLDLCDEMGFVVIDESRELGVNEEQLRGFKAMIDRDRNHPSVILWSVGNEEWGVEWSVAGTEIAREMTAFAHSIDASRPTTYGSSGGRELVKGVDVFGFNYIVQNPVVEYHEKYPEHLEVGTEETTGAGTRGKYLTSNEDGWMTPLNRRDTVGRLNVIEHGWKFYKSHPWAIGIFYWTGQDYRGEPNPMKWPATGSQFGILDYCCFPKDEAFYCQAAWTAEPVVHICGPYNGEVWVYSNCDEVRLYEGKRSLGKQKMPKDGHIVWKVGQGNEFSAKGYIKGRLAAEDNYPFVPSVTSFTASKISLLPDGQDVIVIDIESSEEDIPVSVENAQLLGWGNGDPGFKEVERPLDGRSLCIRPFSGRAQILVRSIESSSGQINVTIGDETLLLQYAE